MITVNFPDVTTTTLWLGLLTRLLAAILLIYVLIQQLAQFKTHSFVQYLKGILLTMGVVAFLSNIVPIIAYSYFLDHKQLTGHILNWGRALNSLESLVVSIALYAIYKTAKNR